MFRSAALSSYRRSRSSASTRSWVAQLGMKRHLSVPIASPAIPVDKKQSPHAVISTFDLFSIGVGPSSSHTVGPWRAAGIFIGDLTKAGLLEQTHTLKITLYGSLAATGKGHATVEALLMGFQGYDCETVDTAIIQPNFRSILDTRALSLAGNHKINFDVEKDIRWRWDAVLPEHPNGMAFSTYTANGDLLALNQYYSIGGGFIVNPHSLQLGGENVYYKQINREAADPARRQQDHGAGGDVVIRHPGETILPAQSTTIATPASDASDQDSTKWAAPPMPFTTAADLLLICKEKNLTIAQVVWNNERHYLSDADIRKKTLALWSVMDQCIREGVSSTEKVLPGGLKLRRRAPSLYRDLMRGFYPEVPEAMNQPPRLEASQAQGMQAHASVTDVSFGDDKLKSVPTITGQLDHPLRPTPKRRTVFPIMQFLSAYAIAVNEVNASMGKVVTAPTNGAAGVIPAVLKYLVEFISHDREADVLTFLLTAASIGMLVKRGATISAAEGGCQAEIGVACSMAAAGFTACMGGSVEQVLQAAEIGLEHNLGSSCDPVEGLVQVPCIERNSMGSVKAITAAQLALSGDGQHFVTLDEVIAAMRDIGRDMHTKFKETSLGGLATSVKIPVNVPSC